MFTGIVTDIGEVVAVEPRAQGLARLRIACGYDPQTIDIGASIACSGVCLTVVARGEEGKRAWFAVEAAAETLRMTTVGDWQRGTRINLERALKVGDELGGHIVAGHADGLATVIAGDTFSVLIIPHTLKATTLGWLGAGDAVNLEVDLMARYAARLMERA